LLSEWIHESPGQRAADLMATERMALPYSHPSLTPPTVADEGVSECPSIWV
jgi:hypothetical protein